MITTLLIVLPNLDDGSSFLPFVRVWAVLVLNSDLVPEAEWWQSPCVLFESLCSLHVTLAEGGLTILKVVLPGWVWKVFAGMDRYEIFDRASKQAHCWRHLGVLIRRVPIL